MSATECQLCGLLYDLEHPPDLETHRQAHADLIRGVLPQDVREFLKEFGWAVAHNDSGLDALVNKYRRDPEKAKRIGTKAVAFAWWARAREQGAPAEDFERYVPTYREKAEAMVEKDQKKLQRAEARIEEWEWEKFAG